MRTCPKCDANLDPQEICDCHKKKAGNVGKARMPKKKEKVKKNNPYTPEYINYLASLQYGKRS